ncbi:MAG: hypothetical protein Hens3KO_25050 [Henriciella sp.]
MTESNSKTPSLPARALRKAARKVKSLSSASKPAVSRRKVYTVGVNAKSRPKLENLNMDRDFIHRSYKDFENISSVDLPHCEALIVNPVYYNPLLIEYAQSNDIPVYNIALALKGPLTPSAHLQPIEISNILSDKQFKELPETLRSQPYDLQLAYVEEQRKSGNRSADFLAEYLNIVAGLLTDDSGVEFSAQLRKYANFIWEASSFNEELHELLTKLIAEIDRTGLRVPNGVFLTFASMLASSGQYDQMIRVFQKALASASLDGYLGLRVKLREAGLTQHATNEDVQLFNRLKSNERSFSNLVAQADGNASIIGNGPQAIGRGLGEKIDQSGLVVRFNTFSTDFPHSQDYGTKTDVWVRMIPHPYVRFEPDLSDLKLVMLTGANRLYRNYNNWQWIKANINRLPGLSFTPSRPYIELAEKLEAFPTSGLLLSYMLYKEIGPLSREQVIGCSFAEPEFRDSEHYHYADSKSGWSTRHAIKREWEFFQTLLKSDEVDYYTPLKAAAVAPNCKLEKISGLNASYSVGGSDHASHDDKWTAREFMTRYGSLWTSSKGIANYTIGGKKVLLHTTSKQKQFDASKKPLMIGFGLRGSADKARKIVAKSQAELALVEYGLISAMGIPSLADFKFSLIVDDLGIFFDTTTRSRTEQLILDGDGDPILKARAKKFIQTVVEHDIVKYNDSPKMALEDVGNKRKILVMDQTSGDLSIEFGQCHKFDFSSMLEHALAQDNAHVFLKLHPETVQGVKDANYDLRTLQGVENLTLIVDNCNAMHLIKQVDEVYVMTSGAGLEALMVGKPVTCFGVPFYAGWGLTTDMQPFSNERVERTLEDVIAAVFLKQTLWFDPITQQETTAERCLEVVIDLLNKTAHRPQPAEAESHM